MAEQPKTKVIYLGIWPFLFQETKSQRIVNLVKNIVIFRSIFGFFTRLFKEKVVENVETTEVKEVEESK